MIASTSNTRSQITEYGSNGFEEEWEDIESMVEEGRARLIRGLGEMSDHASELSTSEGNDLVCTVSPSRISNETRSNVRGLRTYAGWTYIQLHQTLELLLSTLYCILNSTTRPACTSPCGRPPTISPEAQHQLIELVTADAHHRHLPLTQIADLVSIRIGPCAVRRNFR